MRVVVGLLVLTFVLFASVFAGALIVGFKSIWLLAFVGLAAGVLAAEAAKRTTPAASIRTVLKIASICGIAIMAIGALDHFYEYGRLAWGSIILNSTVLLGLLGSYARWQQADTLGKD